MTRYRGERSKGRGVRSSNGGARSPRGRSRWDHGGFRRRLATVAGGKGVERGGARMAQFAVAGGTIPAGAWLSSPVSLAATWGWLHS